MLHICIIKIRSSIKLYQSIVHKEYIFYGICIGNPHFKLSLSHMQNLSVFIVANMYCSFWEINRESIRKFHMSCISLSQNIPITSLEFIFEFCS